MGNEIWRSLRYELYEILCDPKSKKPKEWLNDLITGDIRNLIVNICSFLTANYNVTLGIALPVAALIVKTGVLRFCKKRPKIKPKRSVAQILLRKKENFQVK